MATKTDTPETEKADSADPAEAQNLDAHDFAEMEDSDLDTFIGEAASEEGDGTDEDSGPAPTEPIEPSDANTQTVDDQLEHEEQDTQDGSQVGDADILAEYGLDNYRTLEDQLRGHSELRKKLSQRDEYAEVGRQIAPYYDQFQEWLASQQQQQQQQKPRGSWAPPVERDQSIDQIEAAISAYGNDPNALKQLRASVGEEAWNKWEQYSQFRKNWFDENLFSDPNRFVDAVVVPRVQQVIEERFGQHQMELEAQQTVGQIGDILQDEQGQKILNYALQTGTPQDIAIHYTRLLMASGKQNEKQEEVSRKEEFLNRKRDQLRRRNGKRTGRSSSSPQGVQKQLDGLRRDEVLEKLVELDEAGALPD